MLTISQNENGTLDLSFEVIKNLVTHGVAECYGVVGMASQKITDGIGEIIRGKTPAKGVFVSQDKNGKINIDIYVIVSYGVKIHEVAHNIIEKVSYLLKENLGLEICQIRINVQDVRMVD